jgi:hypothetical protein
MPIAIGRNWKTNAVVTKLQAFAIADLDPASEYCILISLQHHLTS